MKKGVICAVLLMLLCGFACAQGAVGFWTQNTDIYYHLAEHCGGTDGRVPISEAAALAFAKAPCPVCVPEEDGVQDVQAASRGGVVVVKFPDAWLAKQEAEASFGLNSEKHYTGQAAWRMLGEYLHGESYGAFASEYLAGGSAEGRVNIPYIFSMDVQVMSSRHIGSSWYVVVRPEHRFGDGWNLYWRVSSLRLSMDEAGLSCRFDRQSREENRELSLERLDGDAPIFSAANEKYELQIYSALEGFVTVICDLNGNAQAAENMRMTIDGAAEGIELSGYADGGAVVYCCALGQAEVNMLCANASIHLDVFEPMADGFYRVDTGDGYAIYSEAEAQTVFAVEKLNGCDPVDADFRMVQWSGGESRFVLWRQDGPVICDYSGQICVPESAEGMRVGRLTPLGWKNGQGVFLAEAHKYQSYTPEDRLFADAVEYGVRVGSEAEDEWGSYLCYLVDENGNALTGMENRAFTILEDGGILLEALNGDSQLYTPFSD